MTEADLPEWISTGQAAAILDVSRETVRNRLDFGAIVSRKPRVHRQVNTASLLEYRDLHSRPADDPVDADERWLPVVGWEGLYYVSDMGRVRNCKPAKRILRHKVDEKGYHRLTLCRQGSPRRHARVHRLVLEAFVGLCPDGMEACHADCDPANNKLNNLRWDTHPENVMDSIRLGRFRYPPRKEPKKAPRVKKPRVKKPDRKRSRTHCSRRHPRIEWNNAASFRGSGQNRCVACQRARASVNEALRKGKPTLSVDVVADQKFRELQIEHEGKQAA